jgi:hypothetical protein
MAGKPGCPIRDTPDSHPRPRTRPARFRQHGRHEDKEQDQYGPPAALRKKRRRPQRRRCRACRPRRLPRYPAGPRSPPALTTTAWPIKPESAKSPTMSSACSRRWCTPRLLVRVAARDPRLATRRSRSRQEASCQLGVLLAAAPVSARRESNRGFPPPSTTGAIEIDSSSTYPARSAWRMTSAPPMTKTSLLPAASRARAMASSSPFTKVNSAPAGASCGRCVTMKNGTPNRLWPPHASAAS